ncbi:MAG: S1 RNA-binding domain-containing protein [Clostridia bacterium]|nr:S1 RNA-binding domain-containing protein [Clostridia bacterium]
MLEIGAIVEGKVTGLTAFGAFVSLPDGKSGMVHISEVSNTFVKDIKEFLKEGQEVKVKVVGISDEGKISLSIKKASEEPRDSKIRQAGRTRPQGDRPRANVWQGQQKQPKEAMSFEEMMAQFKAVSDEKMSDLKRSTDSRQGSGRRGR